MRSQAQLRAEDTLLCAGGRKSGTLCTRKVRDGFLHFISQIHASLANVARQGAAQPGTDQLRKATIDACEGSTEA